MKVVILCGGQGTRIRDVAENIPKPMISIGRYPILWHIMKTYAGAGHTDFVLCLGHLGHVIKDFFLNYEAFTGDFTISLGPDKAPQVRDNRLISRLLNASPSLDEHMRGLTRSEYVKFYEELYDQEYGSKATRSQN